MTSRKEGGKSAVEWGNLYDCGWETTVEPPQQDTLK